MARMTKEHRGVYLDVADALKRGDLKLLRVCASQADFFCMPVLSRRLNAYIAAIGNLQSTLDALRKELRAWRARNRRRRLSSPPATKTKVGG